MGKLRGLHPGPSALTLVSRSGRRVEAAQTWAALKIQAASPTGCWSVVTEPRVLRGRCSGARHQVTSQQALPEAYFRVHFQREHPWAAGCGQ